MNQSENKPKQQISTKNTVLRKPSSSFSQIREKFNNFEEQSFSPKKSNISINTFSFKNTTTESFKINNKPPRPPPPKNVSFKLYTVSTNPFLEDIKLSNLSETSERSKEYLSETNLLSQSNKSPEILRDSDEIKRTSSSKNMIDILKVSASNNPFLEDTETSNLSEKHNINNEHLNSASSMLSCYQYNKNDLNSNKPPRPQLPIK